MASSTTVVAMDAELLKIVKKDSDERLRKELKNSQDFFSSDQIDNMSRIELIENVAKLRKISGQTTSVKSMISGFNAGQIYLSATCNPEATTPTGSPARALPTQLSVGSSETSSVLFAFMEMMRRRDDESAAAQKRAEAEAESRRIEREEAAAQKKAELEFQRNEREEAAAQKKAELDSQRIEREEAAALKKAEMDHQFAMHKADLEAQANMRQEESRKAEERHQEFLATLRSQNLLMSQANDDAKERATADRERHRGESTKLGIRLERAH